MKQGSPVVGLKSSTHVVLVALKRQNSHFAAFQQKVYTIDDHVGCAVSGLTADGRVLHHFMRSECLGHKYVYDGPYNVGRLMNQVAQKSQKLTQRYSRRPFGVGLLVAGYDATGAHLYETCPSGSVYEYKAYAFGNRSQPPRTYLEKHFETFESLGREDLITHGVRALAKSITDKTVLTLENTSVAVVGEKEHFHELGQDEAKVYLDKINAEVASAAASAAAAGPAPMDTSA